VAEEQYDQIVLGTGLAGLCCAGELVLRGQRPLVICETKEVGAMFRTRTLGDGKNTFFLQHVTWQNGWGGGWWHKLARQLNVPVRLHTPLSWRVTIRGTGVTAPLGAPVSAAALIQTVTDAFGVPLDGDSRATMDAVVQEALCMPYEQLYELKEVLFSHWLEERKVDDFVSALLLTLCGFPHDLNLVQSMDHLSVFGALATLRVVICHEGTMPVIEPNPRDGLLIPLANAIEERGGTIWRSKKVANVTIDGGKVTGVTFADGSDVRGSTVAIATGNQRIRSILDPVPQELIAPLDYTDTITLHDFNSFYLLDEPFLKPDNAVLASFDLAALSVHHWLWPLTGVAPWTTEPGKQLVGSHVAYAPEEVESHGGPDAVYAALLERSEELAPGISDHIVETLNYSSSEAAAWGFPVMAGPKLPWNVSSIDGLWFVGEGSAHARGIWSEAAASAGILGARAMHAGC